MRDSPQSEKWTNLSSSSSDQPEIVLTAAGTDEVNAINIPANTCLQSCLKIQAPFKTLVCECKTEKEKGGPNSMAIHLIIKTQQVVHQ